MKIRIYEIEFDEKASRKDADEVDIDEICRILGRKPPEEHTGPSSSVSEGFDLKN